MSPSVRTRPRSGPAPAPAPLPLSVTVSWASSAKTATRTSPPPSAKPNTTTTCSSPSSASQQPCEQEKRLCPQPWGGRRESGAVLLRPGRAGCHASLSMCRGTLFWQHATAQCQILFGKEVAVMAAGSPTMRRRRLARELTRLREATGMTIREAAGALEWDPSKLSRVEGMQRGIIVRDVRRLLNLYGVTDEAQREALFEMSRESKQRG